MSISKLKIAVVLCCFNRAETTASCLKSIYEQIIEGADLKVVIVDDGSTDNTESALNAFPDLIVLRGTGHLYWGGAMTKAIEYCFLKLDFDYIIWINDDVVLRMSALEEVFKIIETVRQKNTFNNGIFIGPTFDPVSLELTYGGWKSISKLFPLRLKKISVLNTLILEECDSMNGNFVVIPKDIARTVGNIDSAFPHTMGDMDYGYRALRLGFRLYVLPTYVGSCRLNTLTLGYPRYFTEALKQWNNFVSIKHFPPHAWLIFNYRYGGVFWFFSFLNPYVKFWVRSIRNIIYHAK